MRVVILCLCLSALAVALGTDSEHKVKHETHQRADLPPLPSVAILVPTCIDRQFMHGTLLHNFQRQKYEGEMTLVVLDGECKRPRPREMQRNPDTGKKELASKLRSQTMLDAAKTDKRISYNFSFGRVATSVGKKRQWMADNSKSDIIVHMDDDDFYSAEYVGTMVSVLKEEKADFVKLHSFVHYGDLRTDGKKERKFVHVDYSSSSLKMSFGFTFAFRKDLLALVPYQDPPTKRMGEDIAFARAIARHPANLVVKTVDGGGADKCLVLRVVCYGVHRFLGMPDPAHPAGSTLTTLDDTFLDGCDAGTPGGEGDIELYLDNVDWVHRRDEAEALLQFEQEHGDQDHGDQDQVSVSKNTYDGAQQHKGKVQDGTASSHAEDNASDHRHDEL